MDRAVVQLINNHVLVKQDFAEELVEIVKAKKELEQREKEYKEYLENAIRQVVPKNQTYSFENDVIKISLGADTYVETFDAKAFKKFDEATYNVFIRLTPRKGAFKITCKD